jgi:hypothetical protein
VSDSRTALEALVADIERDITRTALIAVLMNACRALAGEPPPTLREVFALVDAHPGST